MRGIVQMPLRPLDGANWAQIVPPGARFDLSQGGLGPYLDPAVLADLARDNLGVFDLTSLLGLSADDPETLLRETLARRYEVAPAQVVPTVGAGQAIVQALVALLRPGDHIVVERPTYEPLYRVPELLGATVTRIDRRMEDGWQLLPERLAKVLTPRTRAVVLTNLHSATGVACPPKILAELAGYAARVGAALLVDEVHLEFAFDDAAACRPACRVADNAISFSSVSKSLGLPHLRVGWLVAPDPDAARALRNAADYLHGRVPAASALLAARALQHLARDMSLRAGRLAAVGLRVVERWVAAETRVEWISPHAGLHGLLRLPVPVSDVQFAQHLRERYETQVVPGSILESPGCVRLGFGGAAPQLEQGLANISAALDDFAGLGDGPPKLAA